MDWERAIIYESSDRNNEKCDIDRLLIICLSHWIHSKHIVCAILSFDYIFSNDCINSVFVHRLWIVESRFVCSINVCTNLRVTNYRIFSFSNFFSTRYSSAIIVKLISRISIKVDSTVRIYLILISTCSCN